MKNLKNKIKSLSESYFKDTVEIRRHLHAFPELSFKEFKTSDYIQQILLDYGIPFTSGVAGTGDIGNEVSSSQVIETGVAGTGAIGTVSVIVNPEWGTGAWGSGAWGE